MVDAGWEGKEEVGLGDQVVVVAAAVVAGDVAGDDDAEDAGDAGDVEGEVVVAAAVGEGDADAPSSLGRRSWDHQQARVGLRAEELADDPWAALDTSEVVAAVGRN